MNKNEIPGWTTYIDEISNGVFKVTLKDSFGRKAEIIDNATDETIEKAISYAFDIEKQISNNWNKFLYNFTVEKTDGDNIKKKDFNNQNFGSWFIELEQKRLVYDGKESCLILQIKTNESWIDFEIIENNKLNYYNYIQKIKLLKE